MVDPVLDDLRRPAGEGLQPCLQHFVLPLHLDGAEALRLPRAVQGQAALLRLIGLGLPDDDGIEHDQIGPVVVKGDDALIHADHICRHADAAVLVREQRVQQVLRRAKVVLRCRLGLLRQKGLVPADLSNHDSSSQHYRFLHYIVSAQRPMRKSERYGKQVEAGACLICEILI